MGIHHVLEKQIEAGGHKPERNLATEPKRPYLKQGCSVSFKKNREVQE